MSEIGVIVADRLRAHRFFTDQPAALVEMVAAHAEPFKIDPRRALVKQGEPAGEFFAIESGRVAIAVHRAHKGLAVIETVEGGEIVGWSWLIPPFRWTFDAVARTPVTGLRIDADALRPLLAENPQVGYALLSGISGVMADRLHSARVRLLDLYGDHDGDD